jgi:hypothetical protein
MNVPVMKQGVAILRFLQEPDKQPVPPSIVAKGTRGALDDLVCEYSDADATLRNEMVQYVRPVFSHLFFSYTRNAAVNAVQRSDPQLLKCGLISLAIENLTFDRRDSLIQLALLNNSALKLGLNPDDFFRSVVPIVSDRFARFLRNFMSRDPQERAIELFGFQEAETGSFDYVPSHLNVRIPVAGGFRGWVHRLLEGMK